MIKNFRLIFFGFLLLLPGLSIGQSSADAAVALSATVQIGPPQVQLSWPAAPAGADLLLFRREKDSTNWYILFTQDNSMATSYTDPTAQFGKVYEYGIQRDVNGTVGFGYVSVAMEAPLVEQRGSVLVFVEAALTTPLSAELERLRRDLAGDGWNVVWHEVAPGATVPAIKNQIIADYTNAPADVKAVMLLGALPVPYSGNTAWDAHPDHAGAWPSDTYYGDIDGFWTDNSVNNTTPARVANDNVPGDGKFDQSTVPSVSELAVGRIDFSRLSETTFGTTRIELYRRYLNKDHRWRVKEYTVDSKALIDDNFGYFMGEAFAANGYRNGYALAGTGNVMTGDFFNDTDNQSFLLGYGCGGGTYTSAGGVGNSTNFATDSVNIVFSMLFGSYHGDWDYSPDPFMPSALASRGGILTVSWAGRPHWFMQHMDAGETVGYSTVETQNTCDNQGYPNYYGSCGTHVTLLGDPTLRAHIIAPAANLSASVDCDEINLNWEASADPGVVGYHLYRSTQPYSGFTRVNTNLLNGTSYTDASAPADTLYYQVRAIRMEDAVSGSYWNSSTGVFASVIFDGGVLPDVSASGGLLTCYSLSDTIRGMSDTPGAGFQWSGPGGFSSNLQNVEVFETGNYTLVVTAPNQCTASTQVTVVADLVAPEVTVSNTSLTCDESAVALPATILGGEAFWEGPGGFVSNDVNPVVSEPGDYILTALNLLNGCTTTATVTVNDDTAPPADVTAAGGTIDCDNATVTLQGNSTTALVTFAWEGPGGFTSTEQDPEVGGPGVYTLTVTAPNGCTASATATVEEDLDVPTATATGGTISCTTAQVQLTGSSSTPGAGYSWTGPGGFSSTEQNPLVNAPGVYTLLVTGPNGCTNTDAATVDTDGSIPNISADGGLLTCYNACDTVRGFSTTPGVSYQWTGNGVTIMQQNALVCDPGIYTLVVTAPNGCTASEEVIVAEDVTPPTASASVAGVINCVNTTAEIQGTVLNGEPFWEGPNGFVAIEANATVTDPGTYTLTALNPLNGCTATATVEVIADTLGPQVQAIGGTLFCADSEVTLMAVVGPDVLIAWPSLPGGATPVVTAPGAYTVVATDVNNGCTSSAIAIVDQVQPFLDAALDAALLTCTGSTLSATASGGTAPYDYQWSNGATENSASYPSGPGTATVTVTDAAGCMVALSADLPVVDTLALAASATDESTAGAADGSASVAVLSGVGPFSYLWSTGATTETIAGLTAGDYTVTVTSTSTGCTQTATVTVETTVGAGDLPEGWQVGLAPNPSVSQTWLDLRLPRPAKVEIQLVDLNGRVLHTIHAGDVQTLRQQINVQDLPAALYLLRIRADEQFWSMKLLRKE